MISILLYYYLVLIPDSRYDAILLVHELSLSKIVNICWRNLLISFSCWCAYAVFIDNLCEWLFLWEYGFVVVICEYNLRDAWEDNIDRAVNDNAQRQGAPAFLCDKCTLPLIRITLTLFEVMNGCRVSLHTYSNISLSSSNKSSGWKNLFRVIL